MSERDRINQKFYNTYAGDFDKIPFKDALIPLLQKYLSASSTILEVGSGAGALAFWLQELGHKVVCVEPAEAPAKKAEEKGLEVHLSRFQEFQTSHKFNSVIAISSLIHISRAEVPEQLQKIRLLLGQQGMAFISFIEGQEEGFEDPTGKGMERFFSKFTEKELNNMLSLHFTILEQHKVEVAKMKQIFLIYALQA